MRTKSVSPLIGASAPLSVFLAKSGVVVVVAAAIHLADRLSEQFGASVVGPVDDQGALLPGDAVDDFDLEVSRAELGLDDQTMKRIVDEAEAIVPDILWL